MFKNLIDSFLIIDAKDKPAPSFLTAFVFTWLVCNYQTTFAFFKINGDFTSRINASLNSTVEYQWYSVLCLTFVLVISRFVLNNAIYYAREFIDNITQKRLTEKNHKSFVSNKVYQGLQTRLSGLQSDLLSSQDREKSAKKAEAEATSEHLELTVARDKFEVKFKSQIENNTELSNKLQQSVEIVKKLNIENDDNKIVIEKLNQSNASIKKDNENIQKENENIQKENDDMVNELSSINKKLKIWSKNSDNLLLNLIVRSDNELNKDEEEALSKLLNSSIVYSDTSREELGSILSRMHLSNINENPSIRSGMQEGHDYQTTRRVNVMPNQNPAKSTK